MDCTRVLINLRSRGLVLWSRHQFKCRSDKPLGTSRGKLPPKLKLTDSENMLFYAFSWRYFLTKKSILEKARLPRILGDDNFLFYSSSIIHHRKKDAAVHFTTIPCEPNTACKAQRKPNFYNICPWTKGIVYARFEDFVTLLCVFMNIVKALAR